MAAKAKAPRKKKKKVESDDEMELSEEELEEELSLSSAKLLEQAERISAGEAHLPSSSALPKKWDKTAAKHADVTLDFERKKKVDLNTGKETSLTKTRFKFIKSTGGSDSARIQKIDDLRANKRSFVNARGQEMTICMASGEVVTLASLQNDHAQAAAEIQQRQKQFIESLNNNPALAKTIMRLPDMDRFVKKGPGKQYQGTELFFDTYFNDIDNLWLISQAANLKKSDQDTLEWLKENEFYGDEFLTQLGELDEDGILKKAGDGRGLAAVLIEYFWERRHVDYAAIMIDIHGDLVKKLEEAALRADRLMTQDPKKAKKLVQKTKQAASTSSMVAGAMLGSSSSESDSDSGGYPQTDEGRDEYNSFLAKEVAKLTQNAKMKRKEIRNAEKKEEQSRSDPSNSRKRRRSTSDASSNSNSASPVAASKKSDSPKPSAKKRSKKTHLKSQSAKGGKKKSQEPDLITPGFKSFTASSASSLSSSSPSTQSFSSSSSSVRKMSDVSDTSGSAVKNSGGSKASNKRVTGR